MLNKPNFYYLLPLTRKITVKITRKKQTNWKLERYPAMLLKILNFMQKPCLYGNKIPATPCVFILSQNWSQRPSVWYIALNEITI